MTFHQCTPDDLALLQHISVQAYRETFASENTEENMEAYLQSAFNSQVLQEALNDSASRFFLAKVDGNAIGYIKLNYAPAQTELHDDTAIELERIYVLQEYQGMGFGKQLLDKAVQYAQEHNKSFLWLGVWEKNSKAIRFYEKNGFRKFSEHVFVMGDDPQTDYLMRIDFVH